MFELKSKALALLTTGHQGDQHKEEHEEVYEVTPERERFLELYLNRKLIASQRHAKGLHKKKKNKILPMLLRDIQQHHAEMATKDEKDSHY